MSNVATLVGNVNINSKPAAFANWKATLVFVGSNKPVFNDGTPCPLVYSGQLDSSGGFIGEASIGMTSKILPAGCEWVFSLQPVNPDAATQLTTATTVTGSTFNAGAFITGFTGPAYAPSGSMRPCYQLSELTELSEGDTAVIVPDGTIWQCTNAVTGTWAEIGGGVTPGEYLEVNPAGSQSTKIPSELESFAVNDSTGAPILLVEMATPNQVSVTGVLAVQPVDNTDKEVLVISDDNGIGILSCESNGNNSQVAIGDGALRVNYSGTVQNQPGILSASSSATVAAMLFSGSPVTGQSGTSNTPLILVQPSGTTAPSWSSSGTFLGFNIPSSFAGDFLQIIQNGNSLFKFSATGVFTAKSINVTNFITDSKLTCPIIESGVSANSDVSGILQVASGSTSSTTYALQGSYISAPCVVVTPIVGGSVTLVQIAAMGAVAVTVSNTQFTINVQTAPTVNVNFNYVVIARN